MSVIQFSPQEHYSMVCDWWTAAGLHSMPLSHLSRLGFVSFSGETPACAGWLYQTDSAFCLFEFVIANPEVRREKRSEALDNLISTAKIVAGAHGFKSIFVNTQSSSLGLRLSKHGFVETDKGMTNFICNVHGGA